jgi:hypothetical protein
MAVTLSADVLRRYRRVTLYNSPYAAHDRGRAVDLYPGDATHPDPEDGDPVLAPSPVAGAVVETRTVTAPSKPYAAAEDHLILVDTAAGDRRVRTAGDETNRGHGDPPIARVLHVDPAVEAGDRVAVGDSLGRLVRAGFFAPWVANHLHLGFRPPGADPYRASGSLPLALDPELGLEAVPWDGTGTVVAAGETYAVLETPAHPAPGDAFAGLAATADAGDGNGNGDDTGVLDGGLPHYGGGGLLGVGREDPAGRTARDPGGADGGSRRRLGRRDRAGERRVRPGTRSRARPRQTGRQTRRRRGRPAGRNGRPGQRRPRRRGMTRPVLSAVSA